MKNPNWPEAIGWPFTSVAEDLNSGRPRTNPASGHRRTWTSDRGITSPTRWPLGHAASLYPRLHLRLGYIWDKLCSSKSSSWSPDLTRSAHLTLLLPSSASVQFLMVLSSYVGCIFLEPSTSYVAKTLPKYFVVAHFFKRSCKQSSSGWPRNLGYKNKLVRRHN